LRFGVRARAATLDNTSPINFGGSYTFAGRLAPELDANNQPVLDSSGQPQLVNITSIESYRRTLLFQRMGLPAAQIRTLGGGASQFTINAGMPSLSVNQEDVGIFLAMIGMRDEISRSTLVSDMNGRRICMIGKM
jgi:hypothetical protein